MFCFSEVELKMVQIKSDSIQLISDMICPLLLEPGDLLCLSFQRKGKELRLYIALSLSLSFSFNFLCLMLILGKLLLGKHGDALMQLSSY